MDSPNLPIGGSYNKGVQKAWRKMKQAELEYEIAAGIRCPKCKGKLMFMDKHMCGK